MAPRSGRPPRSKNPYIISASAVLRSLESANPSRLTTLRLLADAILLYTRSDPRSPRRSNLPPGSHEPGARALANSAVQVLLTLPAVGGALHRRALTLLRATAHSAGASTMLSAAERCRSHMTQLRPSGISDGDVYMESAFAAACWAVAETSRSDFAGRHAAEESIKALLAIRGNRTVRASAAHAAAMIFESFPENFAPEQRLVDTACELLYNICSPAAIAKGNIPKPGFALLAGTLVTHLFSRPQHAEKLLRSTAYALQTAPGSEKAPWAVAVVRVAVVARAARVKRAVRADFEKRTNKQNNAKKVLGASMRSGPPVGDQQLFETVLVTVARVSGLSSARNGCTLALMAVLRMWVTSMPDYCSQVIARSVALLAPEVGSVAAASMLRDAVSTTVISVMEPSTAYVALSALQKLSGIHGRVTDALVVDLCSIVLRQFGAGAVLEPEINSPKEGEDYTTPSLLEELISMARTALATNFAAGRLAGVRLVSALAEAVPSERVQLLTSILQGLRFGDLRLDGADGIGLEDLVSPRGAGRPNSVATGLAAVLGNAVALAALVEECLCCENEEPVPKLVLKQVAVAAINLMRPLAPAREQDHYRERVATAIRRRAGWAIFAALGRVKAVEECVDGGMARLFDHWRDDLGHSERPEVAEGDEASATESELTKKESVPGSVGDLILEPEEVLAETSMRCSALAALAACLQHENSTELRQLAPYLVGASAARVALFRNPNPDTVLPPPISTNTSTIMEDPLFYRGSLNSNSNLSDSTQPDKDHAQLSNELLYLAESMQIAKCSIFAPPVGVSGELCYYIAVALGENAQKALGDATGTPSVGGVVAQFLNSFNKPVAQESSMANRRLSLCTLRTKTGLSECLEGDSDWLQSTLDTSAQPGFLADNLAWMCSTEGVEMPVAEEAIVISSHAISSLVVESISLPGSVCEEFCSSTAFSPVLSATIALAVSKRISASALAENGRVLAMLQVLVANGLKATLEPSAIDGRSYDPTKPLSEGPWNGTCITDEDLPGAILRKMISEPTDEKKNKKQNARNPIFPVEVPLRAVIYNSPQTRALGVVFATGAVTSEAYRLLASKGGSAMWSGLLKSATSTLCAALKDKTPVQVNSATASATVIGTLLKVIPPDQEHSEYVKKAVLALVGALEIGHFVVKSAAAFALNDSLEEVAEISERIMTAISRAWSDDDGIDFSPGKVFKCANDIAYWEVCLERVCYRVLKQNGAGEGKSPTFLSEFLPACALISPALATGATAVLNAAGIHRQNLVEPSIVAAAEVCTELLHWSGVASYPSQAAGFRGLIQMWMARIIMGRMQGVTDGPPRSPEGLSKYSLSAKGSPGTYVPIHFFSIRQPAQAGSSSGLFLEDVIYDAFLSGRAGIQSGLQNAALEVIVLLLRESGRKAVSTHFQRLPQNLFKAASDGLLECKNVLEILADADAVKRPKYWIGLPKAVALGGKRLGAETPGAMWDVSPEARRMAVRIMRIAVTSSFAKDCVETTKGSEADQNGSVLGVFKETLNALRAVIEIKPVDTLTLSEGCGSLKTIAAKFQSVKRLEIVGKTARSGFIEQWPSIAHSLADLLNERNAHRVIQITAETAVQWLLAGCFIEKGNSEIKAASLKLTASLLGKEIAGITRRFEYLEKSDLCGTQTVLATLASISQLIATRKLHSQLFGTLDIDKAYKHHLPVLKNLLYAALGDYNALRSVTCREEISRTGGAISFAGPPGDDIHRCFETYIPWIVVGACIVSGKDGRKTIESISWLDDGSPGAEALRFDEDHHLKMTNLCFAYWYSIVNNSTLIENIFDPCGTFLDVANLAGKSIIECMPVEERKSAQKIVAEFGRPVDAIKKKGIEKFGMLESELDGTMQRLHLAANAYETNGSAEEGNDAASVIDQGNNILDKRGEAIEEPPIKPVPTADAEHTVNGDGNIDDDANVGNTNSGMKEAENEKESRYVNAKGADGRLLSLPLDINSFRDDALHTPAAVVSFDELEENEGNTTNATAVEQLERGPENEPAEAASITVTESVKQGIDVSEDTRKINVDDTSAEKVVMETKPDLAEPAESRREPENHHVAGEKADDDDDDFKSVDGGNEKADDGVGNTNKEAQGNGNTSADETSEGSFLDVVLEEDEKENNESAEFVGDFEPSESGTTEIDRKYAE